MTMKQSSQRSSWPKKKSSGVRDIARLEDIPNVGPSVAGDLRRLGITSPVELAGRDPYATRLNEILMSALKPDGSLYGFPRAVFKAVVESAEERSLPDT